MTEQEAIKILQLDEKEKQLLKNLAPVYEVAIKALEEIQQYREIGTPEECRAAMEKQKEMIAYCEENGCTGCPYWNGSQEDNKCMNDFVSEEIAKNTYG